MATTSRATAMWEGKLKDGRGNFKAASGAFSGAYTFATRFEGAKGTTPEELIAAAHASCFSMALSAGLERAVRPRPASKRGPNARWTWWAVLPRSRRSRCRCAARSRESIRPRFRRRPMTRKQTAPSRSCSRKCDDHAGSEAGVVRAAFTQIKPPTNAAAGRISTPRRASCGPTPRPRGTDSAHRPGGESRRCCRRPPWCESRRVRRSTITELIARWTRTSASAPPPSMSNRRAGQAPRASERATARLQASPPPTSISTLAASARAAGRRAAAHPRPTSPVTTTIAPKRTVAVACGNPRTRCRNGLIHVAMPPSANV